MEGKPLDSRKSMNIPLTPVRFLRYAEENYPTKTAVVCGDERYNYAEFAGRAARLGGALQQAGVKAGDRVAFLSTNCHRLLEAYYGVLEARAILLPLNIRLSFEELAYILNDAGATILFLEKSFLPVVESFRPKLTSVKKFVMLDGTPQESWLAPQNYEQLIAAAQPARIDVTTVDENAVAELFYTSGTSANPKGVMLTHRNIYMHALNACISIHAEENPVELHTIPLFHANGWGVAHSLTFLGGKHVMIHRFDPVEVFRLIEKEGAQTCSLVPIMATVLVNCTERTKYDLSSLKRCTIGGAASSPTLIREVEEALKCVCFSGYGLTETSPTLSLAKVKPGMEWSGEERYVRQAMTGWAILGTEMRVVDPNDNDVPHDGKSIGEIVARGDGIMEGYWNQPESSAEALRNGWFHTGDMATVDKDGFFLVVDRKKDIIVSGGENISSLELEKVILANPAVLEACVIPVPDEKWGEVPRALVVLKPGTSITENELLDFTRQHLAHYKCPRAVDFVDSLPKTGTGKILKRDLRKKYWQGRDTLRTGFDLEQEKA